MATNNKTEVTREALTNKRYINTVLPISVFVLPAASEMFQDCISGPSEATKTKVKCEPQQLTWNLDGSWLTGERVYREQTHCAKGDFPPMTQ